MIDSRNSTIVCTTDHISRDILFILVCARPRLKWRPTERGQDSRELEHNKAGAPDVIPGWR